LHGAAPEAIAAPGRGALVGQLRSLALDAQIVDNSIVEAVTVSSIWPHY